MLPFKTVGPLGSLRWLPLRFLKGPRRDSIRDVTFQNLGLESSLRGSFVD